MKTRYIWTLILLLVLSGCTTTNFTSPIYGNLKRTTFLQKHQFDFEFAVGTNRVRIQNYRNDGGNQAIEVIVKAAVQGAIQGAK